MLAHQGVTGTPVKIPAEDFRLNQGALWTPDGADAIKVRSGVVWGPVAPGSPGGTAGWTHVTGAGEITVQPCRVVIQGQAAGQGHYVGTLDAAAVRTMAE